MTSQALYDGMRQERDTWYARSVQSIAEAERYAASAELLSRKLEALKKLVKAKECIYCGGTGLMASLTAGEEGAELEEDVSCPVCDGVGFQLKE